MRGTLQGPLAAGPRSIHREALRSEAVRRGPREPRVRPPALTLLMVAEAYLDASGIQGHSPRWIHQQGVILADFLRHLEAQRVYQIIHVQPHHLLGFLAVLRTKRGNGLATLHRKGTVCRAWARWAVQTGMVKYSPLAHTILKTPPKPPLDLEPFQDLLEAVASPWDGDLRDALMVLLASGLRRAELFHLRWKDCDLANGLLDVRPQAEWSPKSRKRRAVGIPPWAVAILAQRRTGGGAGPFQTAEGKPVMDPSTLSHAWLKLTRKRGLTARLHDLRHAHATEALARGATIREVQAQLGHASVTTTERYTHLDLASPRRVAAVMADVLQGPAAEA